MLRHKAVPVVVIVVIACASLVSIGHIAAGSARTSTHGAPRGAAPAARARPSAGSLVIETIALSGGAHARIGGEAVLTYDTARRQTAVRLDIHGLAPRTAHAASIALGRCGAASAILHSLPALSPAVRGTGTTVARFAGTYVHRPWSVLVYQGATPPARQRARLLACGNVF